MPRRKPLLMWRCVLLKQTEKLIWSDDRKWGSKWWRQVMSCSKVQNVVLVAFFNCSLFVLLFFYIALCHWVFAGNSRSAMYGLKFCFWTRCWKGHCPCINRLWMFSSNQYNDKSTGLFIQTIISKVGSKDNDSVFKPWPYYSGGVGGLHYL